jgi:hypothetical protein
LTRSLYPETKPQLFSHLPHVGFSSFLCSATEIEEGRRRREKGKRRKRARCCRAERNRRPSENKEPELLPNERKVARDKEPPMSREPEQSKDAAVVHVFTTAVYPYIRPVMTPPSPQHVPAATFLSTPPWTSCDGWERTPTLRR